MSFSDVLSASLCLLILSVVIFTGYFTLCSSLDRQVRAVAESRENYERCLDQVLEGETRE